MKFTTKQMKILQPYEDRFETAVKGNWCRATSQMAIDTINSVLQEVTGTERRVNSSCGACVLSLLKDAGRIYFATKETKKK